MQIAFPSLPVAVVAAIVLFVAKELVESIRRYRSESRKKIALRKLLAFECERNHWAMKNLQHVISLLSDDHSPEDPITFSVDVLSNNRFRFHYATNDEGGSVMLFPVHRDFMSDHLLEVATLDKKLYEHLQQALDSVSELQHLKESLTQFIEDKDYGHLLQGFKEYSTGELSDAYENLNALYVECTGKKLESHRLR